jgi:peptidoglycan/xylan/chitin deacetylase (PgdA/CDA1 family)
MRFGIALTSALIAWTAAGGAAVAQAACPDPSKLGVSRTVEIDTTGGPGFGFDHYKAYDFLRLKEVVLTFDDGPQAQNNTTHMVLAALAYQCTKATFFAIGKMAAGMPEVLRDVSKAGHTVGTHTWSHADIRKIKDEAAWKAEIEKGFSAAHRAVGGPIAPFFRYPALKDTKESLGYLASRNIAVFSADLDSRDFAIRAPEKLVKSVMERLERKTKGILLMHDANPFTAKAVPKLLAELQAKGYKVVHMKPKAPVQTLAEYDQLIEKDMKGLAAGNDRPMSSVIKTIEEAGPAPTAAK